MTGTAHRHFDDELAQLKDRLLRMSAAAQDALDRSVRAVLQRDLDAAGRVVEQDPAIDNLETEIEETVTNLLALHQPMARDLRLLLAALKISNDLERVGDHAVNISICAQRLTESRMIAPEPELIEMGRIAREMLAQSIDAFVRADAVAGREICRRDDQVDALHRSMFRILITHMAEDPHTIGAAMELFLVSRNLERVADLATNIAEDVVFLVEGKSIKHGAERGGPKPGA
jgi:phosphate transport system protein